MEEWALTTPLHGTPWNIPADTAATLHLRADVHVGEAGLVHVKPGGSLTLTYAEGLRTDPTTRPRSVAGGSLQSYVVTEVTDAGPLYVIALNRAAGG